MKANMGVVDKSIRIVVALVVIWLYTMDKIQGTLAYVLLAFSAIFVLTSLISFCPLYTLLGIRTNKKKSS